MTGSPARAKVRATGLTVSPGGRGDSDEPRTNDVAVDALYREQAIELNRPKREAILHRMQQLVYERTIYAPIWQLAFINGVGPRVGESGFGLIAGFSYTAPYEDMTLKG